MAYIYGAKHTAKITPLIKELRVELYPEAYDKIDWPSKRFTVYAADLYKPHSWIVKTIFRKLSPFYATDISFDEFVRQVCTTLDPWPPKECIGKHAGPHPI